MTCPVPPWSPKNIVKLAKYLGISQARLTEHLGISYSALRAWIDGRSKNISDKILSRLRKFENKIPNLRSKAEERFQGLAEREERRKSRLLKPWPVSRIRSFMHTWGMTQVEFALFACVSYDTVTSWSRGRRRLVRKETAEHIGIAEDAAKKRSFPKGSEASENPWVSHRRFFNEKVSEKSLGEVPKLCHGTFGIQVVEKTPGKFRVAQKTEKLKIAAGKKRDEVKVTILLGKKTLKFDGTWQKLGGVKVIELVTDENNPLFFCGKAGCITPSRNLLRISLWSGSDLPVRLTATHHR